jgi:hypothetical protein
MFQVTNVEKFETAEEWTFPRWFVAKQSDSITISIEGKGIPIPGKGENSWDCGDDAIRGVTSSTDWDNSHKEHQRAKTSGEITSSIPFGMKKARPINPDIAQGA